MPLQLSDIAHKPHLLTFEIIIPSGETITLRPLKHTDETILTAFLTSLSPQTRTYYVLDSYDSSGAREMCKAINKYDKLRFLVTKKSTHTAFALIEYSFDIPNGDIKRFLTYGLELDSKTDCRMGPCISDTYQNKGIGTVLFPYLIDIAKQFGQKRMILWGGVFEKNRKAIHFYTKNGFKKLGTFKNNKGNELVDMIIDITDR